MDRQPPSVALLDYPVLTSIAILCVATAIILFLSARYDPSHGPYTISLIVVIGFLATTTFCLFFTVPNDEVTAGVVGGLSTAFGAVVAYWLGRDRSGS